MARSTQPSINPETDELFIPQKLTSLTRDEHRLSPTFNYSRIMRYLVLVDDVLTALDKLAREKEEKRRSASGVIPTLTMEKKVVFPPGAFISMFNATIMALVLQCGTTVAATVIIVFTPPSGSGCRPLIYAAYGGASIVIMFLNIISTIFTRISETRKGLAFVKCFTGFIATTLRRISFLLAFVNGVGLIVSSCFQFAHLLDGCSCNVSFPGAGSISPDWMRNSRIIATAVSAGVMAIYMVFLWFMTRLPDDLER